MTISFNGYFLRLLYGIGSGCLAAFKPRFRPWQDSQKEACRSRCTGLTKVSLRLKEKQNLTRLTFSVGVFLVINYRKSGFQTLKHTK
jgi:hypothetical protein